MNFELDPYNRNASDDELLADLKRVASLLAKETVTLKEQDKLGRFHSMTIRRRFNGWKVALEKASLKHGKRVNIPYEELFESVKNLWVGLGRQPFYSDLSKSDTTFGGTTYIRRFGSWRKALEAFVSYINVEENTSTTTLVSSVHTDRVSRPNSTRDINWRPRFIVMRRDNFKCAACGRSPANDPSVTLDVDHIKAWSKGGPTILENLQTLCTKCNIGKSDLEFTNAPTTEAQNVEILSNQPTPHPHRR